MAIVTRELDIAYGALSIGGSSEYFMPTGKYSYSRGNVDYEVEMSVLVRGSTTTEFESKLDEFLGEIQKRDQDFTLTINGREIVTANASDNSGLNNRATARKTGGDHDTGLSSLYDVTFSGELPQDQSGLSGRRDSSVEVDYQASRIASVTIKTVYTALSSNQARAQYEASIATYAASIMTTLGVTAWGLTSETSGPSDDQDNVIQSTRVYKTMHSKHSDSAFNDSRLRDPVFSITRAVSGPGDFNKDGETPARRLVDVTAEFSAGLDSTQTTDEDIWDSLILPEMIGQTLAAFGSESRAALIGEEPSLAWVDNRIAGRIRLLVTNGGNLLEKSQVVTESNEFGNRVTPVVGPDAYTAVVERGPGTFVVTTETTERRVTGSGGGGGSGNSLFGTTLFNGWAPQEHSNSSFAGSPGGSEGSIQTFAGDEARSREPSRTSRSGAPSVPVSIRQITRTQPNVVLGIPGSGYQLNTEVVTITRVVQFVNAPTTSGGASAPNSASDDSGAGGDDPAAELGAPRSVDQ